MPRSAILKPKFTPSHPSAPWRVYFRGRSFWFKSEKDASKKADELSIGKGILSPRQIDDYLYARHLLGQVPLLSAVRYYIERNPLADQSTTVAEAMDKYLAKASGRPAYVGKMKYLLGILREEHGDERLSIIGRASIESTLDKLSSKWVANDFLRFSRVFFRYCVRHKMIRDDPTEGLTGVDVQASKVILTVEDTRHLLTECAKGYPRLLPAIALQLFTGIRSAEVCRLTWADVRMGKLVNIEPAVSKTKERRVIDWWPLALTNWMPKKPGHGLLVESPGSFPMDKFALVKKCRTSRPEFKFGQNAFRHSYASFGVAYFQNSGKIALLMGHRDVNLLFRHYRDYRTKAEAKEYFTLKRPA